MGFSPSLAGVIAALATLVGLGFGAAAASAEAIPGPPIASAGDRSGAFCALRESSVGDAAGFAAGVAFTAIAARRRERA